MREIANCNLLYDNGDYFAWGETATKSDYSWMTYVGDPAQFIGDNKTVLEPVDDVATQSWGEQWRMPTAEEWNELYDNTTREWTDNYMGTGVKGYILTSKKAGHTDASIFLPAAGYFDGSDEPYNVGYYGFYWSSSLSGDYSYDGRYLDFYSGNFFTDYNDRCDGYSVRPVCPAQK